MDEKVKALAAAKELSFLWDEWENHKGYWPTMQDMAAIISKHFPAEAAVPVSELQHIVDNVSALKDLRIKLQQLIHRYQPAEAEHD